jgi:hypothetical protein
VIPVDMNEFEFGGTCVEICNVSVAVNRL